MSNVIDFNRKRNNQDKSNPIINAIQVVCPCRNNAFMFSRSQSTEQTRFLLQCINCNQAYDVTDVLVQMADKEKEQSI